MRDYKNIDAWKLADDLTVVLYDLTRRFPKEELYGLTSQLRRAAAAVPTNIAEGSARESQKDYLHFLYIARGSLTETQYLLHLAHRLGYINVDDATKFGSETKRVFGCLHGLIQSVEKQAGKIAGTFAAITSILVLSLARISGVSVPTLG
jgi:four helix bundle protein